MQVMVKVTGGGRNMKAIAAHGRYIGRQGKEEVGGKGKALEIEDDRGEKIQGRDGLVQLIDEWLVAGAYIDDACWVPSSGSSIVLMIAKHLRCLIT